MLLSGHADAPRPLNFITINQLPTYIDKQQPPTKKEPFRTICDHAPCHTLSLVASADYVTDDLERAIQDDGTLHYARVHMKLLDIISGDFFDNYIKTGNILMLSEGRPGIDETYSLREGVLRIEVDKPTFERIGLEGKVIPSQGRKHVKARYAIELNLRLPSMVRGKKGFERVVWAFTNVLVDSKTWLFSNLKNPADFSGPISAHAPAVRQTSPALQRCAALTAPKLNLDGKMDEFDLLDLQEWLSLVILNSPRIRSHDKIDEYLSRYEVPAVVQASASDRTGVLRTQWRGLLHPDFIKALYMQLLKSGASTGWLAISAHAFDGTAYTVIRKDKVVAVCRYTG